MCEDVDVVNYCKFPQDLRDAMLQIPIDRRFDPCPLCGSEVNVYLNADGVNVVHCVHCNLVITDKEATLLLTKWNRRYDRANF